MLGTDAKRLGDTVGNQRRNHARHEGSVIHDADAYNLHGENCRGERSTKQCGKSGAHATHNHDVLVLFIEAEQPSKSVSDTSAKL